MKMMLLLPLAAAFLRRQEQGPAVCPGSEGNRVWYACKGPDFAPTNDDALVSGVTLANEMCCTPEYEFACLCCIDFANLEFSRCGAVDLDAANQPAGSPTAMEDDAVTPGFLLAAARAARNHSLTQQKQPMGGAPAGGAPAGGAAPGGPTEAPGAAPGAGPGPGPGPGPGAGGWQPPVVTICTNDQAVGAIAATSGAASANLPATCFPRSFTMPELKGVQPDPMGMPLTPGQVVLDLRLEFLTQQGVPEIPTCHQHYSDLTQGAPICPAGTPLAGKQPNTAGAAALAGDFSSYAMTGGAPATEVVKLAEFAEETKASRTFASRGRTFLDLAAMGKDDLEKILGEDKLVAFKAGQRVQKFRVEEVRTEGGLTLEGEGRKVVVVGGKISFTDGKDTMDVDPSDYVITMHHHTQRKMMGRRAAFLVTSGSFTLSSGGGNEMR